VPAQDVDALAGAILELTDDEPLRRRLGEAARSTAEAYTIEAVGPRWDELLDELAPGPRRNRAWQAAHAVGSVPV
jgi:glycosyltransferase involved in cell wall biosynthesis